MENNQVPSRLFISTIIVEEEEYNELYRLTYYGVVKKDYSEKEEDAEGIIFRAWEKEECSIELLPYSIRQQLLEECEPGYEDLVKKILFSLPLLVSIITIEKEEYDEYYQLMDNRVVTKAFYGKEENADGTFPLIGSKENLDIKLLPYSIKQQLLEECEPGCETLAKEILFLVPLS